MADRGWSRCSATDGAPSAGALAGAWLGFGGEFAGWVDATLGRLAPVRLAAALLPHHLVRRWWNPGPGRGRVGSWASHHPERGQDRAGEPPLIALE